jgi:iron complex transport system ATP-binding protein
MSTRPILELTNATVVKGDVPVLDDLTLTIREGEHTAIIGPNGSGKSTLVNLITFQDRALAPSNGMPPVQVLGDANWSIFDLRQRMGVVSAETQHRFIAGNSEGPILAEAAVVSAFLGSQGILRYGDITRDMRHRALDALERMGAADLAGKPLDAMSSGEVRRVLLARALVTNPTALLLDEPTTGLDLVARSRFMETVRGVARDGTTLILISHHLEEIVPEIQRVVLLRRGRISAAGPKMEVLTTSRVSDAFEAPIALRLVNGYFHAEM